MYDFKGNLLDSISVQDLPVDGSRDCIIDSNSFLYRTDKFLITARDEPFELYSVQNKKFELLNVTIHNFDYTSFPETN